MPFGTVFAQRHSELRQVPLERYEFPPEVAAVKAPFVGHVDHL
jgi:hypothetical protein